MILLGLILLIVGAVFGVGILFTLGVLLVLIGAALWLAGAVGHAVGGRKHYW